MQAHLYQAICDLRQLIHAAEPPYEKPHEYMNVMRPLTPLKYECVEGQHVPRISALRHALYLLHQAETILRGCEKSSDERQRSTCLSVLATVKSANGILWSYGIEFPDVGQMPIAA